MTFSLLLVLVPLLYAAAVAHAAAPEPLQPVPSRQQLEWQRGELTMFVHFTVNTFTDKEWGEGTEDPKIFNPVDLDAAQWARAAKAGGFTLMILTVKHHDGFCLWPSKYTDHSVKSSPWKNGKGDVVREFVDAARKEGLRVGLYLSPWDRHERTYGDSPRYNEYYKNQLTEILTGYGPIAEVWFDGACGEGPNGKRQEYDWEGFRATVRKLQPDAVMFSDAGPDIRWIGNEKGTAGDPCWSTVDPAKVTFPGQSGHEVINSLQHGDVGGTVWRPGECDVSIRPGWFWHRKEDDKVRSLENLVDLYFKSVGRNSLLLLNIPPNDKGLFFDVDVQRIAEFRAKLDVMFKKNLAAGCSATASNTRGNDAAFGPAHALDGKFDSYWATDDGVKEAWLEVDLGKPTKFNVACLQENIALGQRIEAYRLERWDGNAWQAIAKGTTVGYKKLERFDAITAQRVRCTVEKSRAAITLQTFALYCAE
jgi:alpha-L-fucosidase